MRFRTAGVFRMLVLGAVLPAIALVAVACSGSGSAPSQPEAPDTPLGAVVLNPRPMPNLKLPDTNGKLIELDFDTKGRLTLVYLGYTFCPDVCPTEMADLAAGLTLVSPAIRDKVDVIFITVDPERDTPEVLERWLAQFNPDFVGLIPKPEDVDKVAHEFGMAVPERTQIGGEYYTVSHAAYIRAFTTDGVMRYIFPAGFSPMSWKHDLELLVTREKEFLP